MAEAVRDEDSEVRDGMKLVADLMGQSARDLAWTRDRIEEDLRRDVVAFVGWRAFVIKSIEETCAGRYAPNPLMILKILDSNAAFLDIRARQYLEDQETT